MSAHGPGVRVKIYKNQPNQTEPKLLVVPSAFDDFLKQAGKKLGINARFAYSASGALIDDVDVLREDEEVYISEKSGFYRSESSAKKLRIVVLGPGGVGKSCLTLRYTRSTFVESYDPTIEDAFRHQSLVDDRVVIMEILDTAGQEEFTCLSQSWVENKDGFLLVFSLIDGSSFNSLNTYYQMVVKEYDAKEKGRPPIVLVGNKADLLERRQVPQSQILERAQLWRCEYIETSAKTGLNVDKCFATLVRAIRALQNDEQPSGGGSSGRNGGRRSDKKSKICFIL